MKKLTIILLTCTLLLSLMACGGAGSGADTGTTADMTVDGTDGAPSAKEVDTSSADSPVDKEEEGETDPAAAAVVTAAEEPAITEDTPEEAIPAVTDKPVEQPAPAEAHIEDDTPPEKPQAAPAEQPAVTPAAPEPEPSAPQPETQPEPPAEPPAAAATADTASAYIGQNVSSLIAALGEPGSRTYAPSCLGEGEDGELSYSGFTVYTYRENGTETVQAVE